MPHAWGLCESKADRHRGGAGPGGGVGGEESLNK